MRSRLLPLVPLFGLLTACQTAPEGTDAQATAPRSDVALPREAVLDARVPANATLESLLRQNAVSGDLTAPLIASVRPVFNPRELRANQPYSIRRTLDGLFQEFRYEIDPDRFLRVVFRDRTTDGAPQFDVEVVPVPKEMVLDAVSAEITREHPSLVGAFDSFGENIQLALQLADIFGGVVDFNSDLQLHDRIEVLFERVRRGDEVSGYGRIQAAVLETAGRRYTAIPYVGPDGTLSWYDETGRSLKRQFLKSPLPFEPRITSRFSYRRVNPVHGDVRPHLGVDYGAPIGTAVKAVADGVVEVAAWSGDAGRLVKLRHSGGYETAYLHLSSFAPGIRPGTRVEQGQLIGRVGMTGSATGPHLDYRILRNGTYLNPIAELAKMPSGDPIAGDALPAFTAARDAALVSLHDHVTAAAATASPTGAARRPQ